MMYMCLPPQGTKVSPISPNQMTRLFVNKKLRFTRLELVVLVNIFIIHLELVNKILAVLRFSDWEASF